MPNLVLISTQWVGLFYIWLPPHAEHVLNMCWWQTPVMKKARRGGTLTKMGQRMSFVKECHHWPLGKNMLSLNVITHFTPKLKIDSWNEFYISIQPKTSFQTISWHHKKLIFTYFDSQLASWIQIIKIWIRHVKISQKGVSQVIVCWVCFSKVEFDIFRCPLCQPSWFLN